MWESQLIINPKKKFQSHRNGEGTLENKGKGKKFFKYDASKKFYEVWKPFKKEKNIYKSHREDKIVSNECFQGPSLEKKLNEIWKKNSKLLLWGKKIQSPKFTAVSASKTLLILANGTSSRIVHGWVFSLGLGKFTLALKKVVVSGHLVLKKKFFFQQYLLCFIDWQPSVFEWTVCKF